MEGLLWLILYPPIAMVAAVIGGIKRAFRRAS